MGEWVQFRKTFMYSHDCISTVFISLIWDCEEELQIKSEMCIESI